MYKQSAASIELSSAMMPPTVKLDLVNAVGTANPKRHPHTAVVSVGEQRSYERSQVPWYRKEPEQSEDERSYQKHSAKGHSADKLEILGRNRTTVHVDEHRISGMKNNV
ncbi:hypothetical protein DIS24_g12465 [Lasiodiplodia hormozganensis]|uniref:Uncharacterized protein n=1 Tax=Lasiodiplodia hormozganensis TaxID=869390 RepID=A0AA39T0C0_9PEZI|nr:hypothetical protein DIS24_g12465 [Lasiodiplodia hormozganensis]